MQRSLIGLLAILCAPTAVASDHVDQGRVLKSMPAVEPHRTRIETINRNLTERLDDLLPRLMRETGSKYSPSACHTKPSAESSETASRCGGARRSSASATRCNNASISVSDIWQPSSG